MASLREASRSVWALPISQLRRQVAYSLSSRRNTSTQAAAAAAQSVSPDLSDLETNSSLGAPPPSIEDKKDYRPWKRAKEREENLPASRYQYHPPKYNRGPLHPIQSPESSDPVARDFIPGPFNVPRLKETYESTIASDLMTLAYNHVPPGTEKAERAERLRFWDGSSPYHKNRPRRGPRGHSQLPLIERDITFRNIPEIREVSLAVFLPNATKSPDLLVPARTMLLALTGRMPEMTATRSNVAGWSIAKGKRAGVKVTIHNEEAYEFLDRCIHLVFPRIKDWKGIEGTTGDGSGNLSWGFTPDDMQLFPEVEVNYNMYPAKQLPGCRIVVKTTATSDRQARLLLEAMGVPFIGKIRD